jgi:hypothetical protein
LAKQQECFWHYTVAQRLLGQALTSRGYYQQARFWLQQALQSFQQKAMRREEEQTQQLLNNLLVKEREEEYYL